MGRTYTVNWQNVRHDLLLMAGSLLGLFILSATSVTNRAGKEQKAQLLKGADTHSYASGWRVRTVEPVREELGRVQREVGLTLSWYEKKIYEVLFESRAIVHRNELYLGATETGTLSRDGKEIAVQFTYMGKLGGPSLGVIRSDGSHFREYAEIATPVAMCWSYDDSKIAVTSAANRQSPDSVLRVLDLSSSGEQELDVRADVTSQCWSPDNGKLAYAADGTVRVWTAGAPTSSIRVLAKGKQPTWSPDGNWIAFLDDDTYYVVDPTGQQRKALFHKKGATSGL
jgi:WD40 repeat protein